MKKWKALATFAVAAALVVAPLSAGAALADDGVPPGDGTVEVSVEITPLDEPAVTDPAPPAEEVVPPAEDVAPPAEEVTPPAEEEVAPAPEESAPVDESAKGGEDKGGYPHWEKVVPEPPVWVDPCGPGNAYWSFPENPEGYWYKTFSLYNHQVVVIVPNQGTIFPWDTKVLFKNADDGLNCETALPAQYNVEPGPASCGVAGTLADVRGLFDHVTITVTPEYDGPGGYLIQADTDWGYVFPDGTTHKERFIVVPVAVPFQNADEEAPCFFSIVPAPAAPDFQDACGTANDDWTVPNDTDQFFYEVVEDGNTVTITAVLRGENDEWAEGVVTQWTHTFTDVACVTPTTPGTPAALAATGGPDMGIWGMGGIATLLMGVSFMALQAWRRSRA